MTRGPVEYALVHTTGKTHESIFTTDIAPRDLHLALILLGIKPTAPSAPAEQVLATPNASAVRITVEWETNGPRVSHPLAAMVSLAADNPSESTTRTLTTDRWLYVGSAFDPTGFRAQREGSIISLITDSAALACNPGTDRSRDDLHVPNASTLPKTGTPVTVTVQSVASP